VAVSPTGPEAGDIYVASNLVLPGINNQVSVINPATNAVITTVNVSNFGTEVPQYGVAVSPTGPAAGDVYVSSFTSESVLIINPATNAVAPNTIDIPNGSGLLGWRPAPPAPKPATSTSSTRSPAM
jgi:DNA-binding beta-propeller fold protein YncE